MFDFDYRANDPISKRLWLLNSPEYVYGLFGGDGGGGGGSGGGDGGDDGDDGGFGYGGMEGDEGPDDGGPGNVGAGPAADGYGGDDSPGFGPSPGRSQAEFGSPVGPSTTPGPGPSGAPSSVPTPQSRPSTTPGFGPSPGRNMAQFGTPTDPFASETMAGLMSPANIARSKADKTMGKTPDQIASLQASFISQTLSKAPFGFGTQRSFRSGNITTDLTAAQDFLGRNFGAVSRMGITGYEVGKVAAPDVMSVASTAIGIGLTAMGLPGPVAGALGNVAGYGVATAVSDTSAISVNDVVGSAISGAIGSFAGSQVAGVVGPAVAQGVYGATESVPGAIAGGVVAGGLAGGFVGGVAEDVAGQAISDAISGSSTTSVDPSSAAPSGSSGMTEQAEQSGISVTGYAESAANNNTSSNAMSGGTTPGVDTTAVADTAESTTSFGITGVSDSATFGQTSGRQTYGGRSFGGGQFAGSQFTGRQFGGYSPTVQFSAEGGQVAQQGMQQREPLLADILDEVGRDAYTLSKFGYKPSKVEVEKSIVAKTNPKLEDPLRQMMSFLTNAEIKKHSKGYTPVSDIVSELLMPSQKVNTQNYAEGGTVQDPTMVGQPETRETLSPNNVADDVPMNGEDGGFVINAPAVAQSGKMYIQDLISEATDSLRAKGNRVLTQAGKEVNEDVVPLMVSEGEVYLPPEIAEEIGISRLEKINNRGKKKVAKLQKQAKEQAPREGFVAVPA